MSNWKELVFTDNVPNLGNSDLTSTDNVRNFYLKQESNTASKSLKIQGVTESGVTPTAPGMNITSSFNIDSSVAPETSVEFAAKDMSFSATTGLTFNSDFFWSCVAPIPFFSCNSFVIRNQGQGASQNPVLSLERLPDNDQGGDDDLLGVIDFRGEDSGGVSTKYASIETSIVDATNPEEDGRLDIRLMNAGTVASALKILPQGTASVSNKLDSLEVYGTALKDLLTGFQKYSLKSSYKMYLNPQHGYGFQSQHGYIMSFTPGQDSQTNPAYIIEPSAMTDFAAGNATLDGVAGDALSSFQDSENVGYGDAWLIYDHPSDAPAVTVEISGHVWWKPRMDPPAGQSLSFWFAHEDIADGYVQDINEDTGIKFVYEGNTPTHVLSDGEEVTKMPFSFSKTLTAANGVAKQHMFLLGSDIKSTETVDYIGQATTTEANNWNNMVVDVTMTAYPT